MIERLFGPSWRTSLAGYVIMICGSTGIADEISPFCRNVSATACMRCLLSVTFGLTSAKDANVTHTPALAATEPKPSNRRCAMPWTDGFGTFQPPV